MPEAPQARAVQAKDRRQQMAIRRKKQVL